VKVVEVSVLEDSRCVIVWWRQLPVRLGDRESDILGDVRGVVAPRPQVKRPGALVAARLLLQVVDRTALPDRHGCHLLGLAVDRDALDAHLDAELPVDVGGIAALAPGREVKNAAPSVDGAPV
jgi:hypothetical protein